jgi:hypothetical protein
VDHKPLALAQTLVPESEPAKLIVVVGINAGIVENEIGCEGVEQRRDVSPQHGEVRGVRHTVVEPNIEVTRDLTEGVVLLCINGEGVRRSSAGAVKRGVRARS